MPAAKSPSLWKMVRRALPRLADWDIQDSYRRNPECPAIRRLTNRVNLAIPPQFNLMTGIQQWQIRPEAVYLFGRVASQLQYGSQYVGGANQIFIYKPWQNGTLVQP